MYTLKLNDGTEIKNLSLKGNVFISTSALSRSQFTGKLSPVEITGESGTGEDEGGELMYCGVHEAMQLCYLRNEGGVWKAALSDIPAEEYKYAKIRGDIDYLAMMGDIEL